MPLRESRSPALNAMTERTIVARGNVQRWFTFGYYAVVTTETGPQNRAVIDPFRFPVMGVMAVFTAGGRRYVTGILALGDNAVVAKNTITGNVQVIKLPAESGMAVVTGISARHMSGILALGDDTVVAAGTATDHDRVIDLDHVGP